MRITAPPSRWGGPRPIKVDYRGITFRSTLEADWAATLDSLTIAWQYEPQGITLPSGTTYRPDFYLPAIGTWLEVKGPGIPGAEKAIELAEAVRCDCMGFDVYDETHGDCSRDWRYAIDGCDCQWSGGEQVIIGLAPAPGIDDQAGGDGYASWVNAAGPTLGLTSCANCAANWWLELRERSRPVNCRVCNTPTSEDVWAVSGDVPFMRARPKRRRFPFGRRP